MAKKSRLTQREKWLQEYDQERSRYIDYGKKANNKYYYRDADVMENYNKKYGTNKGKASSPMTNYFDKLRAEVEAYDQLPKPKPASQGMGDFRQAESKLPPFLPPKPNKAKEQRERFTKTLPEFLQKPVSKVNNFLTHLEESKPGKFYLRSGEKAANTAFLNNEDSKTSTGSKKLDFVADILGGLGGFVNPQAPANAVFKGGTMLAEKGLGKLAPKLAQSKLATNVIGGAGAGATTGTAEGIVEGKNAKETAKLALQRGAEFGAIGAGGTLIGKGLKKVVESKPLDFLRNLGKKEGAPDLLPMLEKQIKPNNPQTKQFIDNILNANKNSPLKLPIIKQKPKVDINTLLIPKKPIVGQMKGGLEDIILKQPSEIASTAKKIVNEANPTLILKDINKPKLQLAPQNSILDLLKPRGFAQTVKSSDTTIPELRKALEAKDMTYNTINNRETLKEAQKVINTNLDDAIRIVRQDSPATAKSNAVAQLLIQKAQQEGRFQDAIDLVEVTAKKATSQGQAIQALSMWGRLTPEGMLKYAQNVIDRANRVNPKLKLKLDPKAAEEITKGMEKVQQMPEGRAKTVEIAKILEKVKGQVPATLLQKISTVQTMAQLLNPKTTIRNVIGNTGFAGLENISGVVGAGLDKAIGTVTGVRTKLLPDIFGQVKSGAKGFKLGLDDAIKGIDTLGTKTQFDIPNTKVFRSGVGDKLEKLLNVTLKAPDRAFYQAAYDESLRQQMKTAKIDIPTNEMKEIAHFDGLYRTFQDENYLSKMFSWIKKSLNADKEFGLGDLVIKYPKTPANLLARGLDYSPLGFINAAYKLLADTATGALKQKQFVERTSRAMVGSAGLLGAGALLHRLGIITGEKTGDTDLDTLLRDEGFGAYRVNVDGLKRFLLSGGDPSEAQVRKGDTIISYDWFQPASIGLAIGADIDRNKGRATGLVGTIIDALGTGTQTLTEQPLLQGLKKMVGYNDMVGGLVETAKSVPSSFIPTFLNQTKQLVDNQARSTYDPKPTKEALNMVTAKLPFLSKTLQPQVSTLGQDRPMYQTEGLQRVFDIFLNPSFVKDYNPTPEAKLVLDIYNNTGDNIQVPRYLKKTIDVSHSVPVGNGFKVTKKEKIDLTPEEYTELQRFVGQKVATMFRKFSSDPKFMKLPDEIKAKEMQGILTDVGKEGKAMILKKRGLLPLK